MIFFGTTQNPPWDRCTKTEARSPELKMFHAIMLVTREWCVEAETAEEAHQLLAAGHGHRCHLGDRVHLEVHRVED